MYKDNLPNSSIIYENFEFPHKNSYLLIYPDSMKMQNLIVKDGY